MSRASIVHTESPAPRPWAILLAAGAGTRLASVTGQPKQFLAYQNAPLYWHSALTFSRVAPVAGLIFVFPAERLAEERARLAQLDTCHTLGLPWLAVAGGARRQDSVRRGLLALPTQTAHVLVHDTARPFASPALVARVCEALAHGAGGVIPGLPVTDTIKVVQESVVTHTPERASLVAVQTPQGFNAELLRAAHQRAEAELWEVTDDAALLERCGHPVTVVAGDAQNVKLTHPEDLRMLEKAAPPSVPCTGFGYDVHRFGSGRPLKLGGVPMQGGLEVVAHSDGDVLLHALMDALLGCAGLGDIGQHFPDTAAAFDNADSAVLLDEVLRLTAQKGLILQHVDMTIITQVPKIAPQRAAIHAQVTRLLGLAPEQVNVKATTEEGLGFTGAGQGIKAVAVVTALRSPSLPQTKAE